MAELDDIRQGLAALLRGPMPPADTDDTTGGQVSAYLLETPTTPSLMVAGVDPGGFSGLDFGDGHRWVILVEAWLGKVSSTGAQKLLNRLIPAVADAVESDNTNTGALFSRLQDDGTILEDQDAAAASVAFLDYRGQSRFLSPIGQVEYLLATWAVEVIT